MSNKERICDLFYNKHQNQTEIATAVGVSQQYVSKIIQADMKVKKKVEKPNMPKKEKQSKPKARKVKENK